ncbi:polyprenyl synthetase family protein [Microbacterium sp. NIBRBAC000506063]|uniref:polyprenyl synthetase family protein n=1 Tax=Microbacterium sp. NIBRBAC000506063 TaxID=2734618 RepID=UPI002948BDBC|nr:polyprenyl synthetase family protein [Microbacterium sp. NIBRBAC000506063]
MSTPSPVIGAVEQRLRRFVEEMRRSGSEYGPDAGILFDAAESALNGGKRMRARFCHAGWSAVARRAAAHSPEPDALWAVCASLEAFQAAALVHDDIIDNSDTRRGRPAAHRALESRHEELRWRGDAEGFGRSSAILLGDLLLAWSDDLLEEALTEHAHAASVRASMRRCAGTSRSGSSSTSPRSRRGP